VKPSLFGSLSVCRQRSIFLGQDWDLIEENLEARLSILKFHSSLVSVSNLSGSMYSNNLK
jgi:hypothetical protein